MKKLNTLALLSALISSSAFAWVQDEQLVKQVYNGNLGSIGFYLGHGITLTVQPDEITHDSGLWARGLKEPRFGKKEITNSKTRGCFKNVAFDAQGHLFSYTYETELDPEIIHAIHLKKGEYTLVANVVIDRRGNDGITYTWKSGSVRIYDASGKGNFIKEIPPRTGYIKPGYGFQGDSWYHKLMMENICSN